MTTNYTFAKTRHLTDTLLSDPPGQTVITGGIMCFSVEPITQNIYILLGRETCFEKMDSPHGTWCDFGGKINENESAISGAAREFSEESLCIVRMSDKYEHTYTDYIDRIKNMLQDENYFMKISIILPQRNGVENARVYYIKEIPWQPDIEGKFDVVRRKLSDVHHSGVPFSLRNHPSVMEDQQVNRHFLEKHSISWWSIDRLSEVVRNRGKYKNQQFRRSFLPILRLVVHKLQDFYY
jgi:hypothetical protein